MLLDEKRKEGKRVLSHTLGNLCRRDLRSHWNFRCHNQLRFYHPTATVDLQARLAGKKTLHTPI